MSEDERPRPAYSVYVEGNPGYLYRMARSPDSAEDWQSNYDRGLRRRIRAGEDSAIHRGMSAWDSLEAARQVAVLLNRRGKGPRFTHIVQFTLKPDHRCAFAHTRSPGHLTVWGSLEDFDRHDVYSLEKHG